MEIDALVWERNGGVDGGRVRTRTWDEFHGLRDDLGIICVPIGAKSWCARSKLRGSDDGGGRFQTVCRHQASCS